MLDGKPIKLNFKKLTAEEKEYYANEFSEGSSDLKNLLLKMWDNGINTIACCAGHDNGTGKLKILSPYISFYIDKFSPKDLKRIVSRIIEGYDQGILGFIFSINKDKGANITIRTYDDELRKSLFTFVDDLIFNENSAYEIKQNEMVETILDMLSLSFRQYLKSKGSPTNRYSLLSVRTIGPYKKMYLVSRDDCVYKKINNKIGTIKLAEGFYVSVDKYGYIGLKNNKVIKLNSDEVTNYKKLKTYKKFNSTRELNLIELKQIIKEIKLHQ